MICSEELSFGPGPAPYFIFGLSQKRARKGHNSRQTLPSLSTQTGQDDLICFNPCLNPYFWRVRVMWIIFWRNLVLGSLAVSWVIMNCLSLSTFLHLLLVTPPVRGHAAAHPSFHCRHLYLILTRNFVANSGPRSVMSALMYGTGAWFGLSFTWQSRPTDTGPAPRCAHYSGHNEN